MQLRKMPKEWNMGTKTMRQNVRNTFRALPPTIANGYDTKYLVRG
jgi:hypothetical protein